MPLPVCRVVRYSGWQIRTLDPLQANAPISDEHLDVVHVRGLREWSDRRDRSKAEVGPWECPVARRHRVRLRSRGAQSRFGQAGRGGWAGELCSADGETAGWMGAGLPIVYG